LEANREYGDGQQRPLSVISDLKNLGISVSTIDFGTGYSSLDRRFPFSRLKLTVRSSAKWIRT